MKPDAKARLPLGKRARFFVLALALALVLGLAAGLWALRARNASYQLDTFSMGSYVRQTRWGPGGEEAARQAAWAVDALEGELTWREEASQSQGGRKGAVFLLNQAAGTAPVSLPPAIGGLLDQLLDLSRKSGGAFDPTIGPVSRLWSFDSEPRLPAPQELKAALTLVGYDRLVTGEEAFFELTSVSRELFDGNAAPLEQAAALLDPGMSIDLGAAGKGAACDTALEEYRRAGIKGAVVAVGGSIGLYGKKPDGKDFRVSVRSPEGEGSLGVLELPGGFVSTSGSYEKFFQQDGRTYCHLLDPRTGYPAESGLTSVTVWCQDSGALSDGLATACFVLGLEEALALLEEYGAQGVFVTNDRRVAATPGLRERFRLTAPGYTMEALP